MLRRYRTLIDRILGMRLIYAQRSLNRNVSFEFLNRQLVWEAFTVRNFPAPATFSNTKPMIAALGVPTVSRTTHESPPTPSTLLPSSTIRWIPLQTCLLGLVLFACTCAQSPSLACSPRDSRDSIDQIREGSRRKTPRQTSYAPSNDLSRMLRRCFDIPYCTPLERSYLLLRSACHHFFRGARHFGTSSLSG